ncbi:unnamed protein product, partial [Allacma fusca]
MEKWIIEPK